MENRTYTRVRYAVGASISYGKQVAICTTGNFSLRGMYLKTGYDIPLNTQVQVTVFHPDNSSFRLKASVVRKATEGIGLQIEDMSIDSFVSLREIIAKQGGEQGAILQETYKVLKYIH